MKKQALKIAVEKGLKGNFALYLHVVFNEKEEHKEKSVIENKDFAKKLFSAKYVFVRRKIDNLKSKCYARITYSSIYKNIKQWSKEFNSLDYNSKEI